MVTPILEEGNVMLLCDLQVPCFAKSCRGELGNVEFVGFRTSNVENPLQMELRDLSNGMSKFVNFDRNDGSIISDPSI